MPCWILQTLAPTQCHTAPWPSIQLNKPDASILVAKQLDHEQAPPGRIPNKLLSLRLDVVSHRLRCASTGARALRVHHPNPVMTAPCPNAFRRAEPKQSLANSSYEGLGQQRNVFLPLIHGVI